MMTEPAQEGAHDAPWDLVEMRTISQQDRDLEEMSSRAKTIQFYTDPDAEDSDDSDDDVDYQNVEIEMNRQATEAFLFKKASSNQSVDTLGTKPKTSKQTRVNDVASDEEASITDTPSPKKKQRAHHETIDNPNLDHETLQKMFWYFESNNIDVNSIDVSTVTTATAVATAQMHNATDSNVAAVAPNDASATSTLQQDREPVTGQDESPGSAMDLGDGL